MTPFELLEPASLKEAIALIDPDDPTVRPIAGGTALMLMMKAGVYRPRRLISLRRLNGGMSGITAEGGALVIGAMTPLAQLEHSPQVAQHAPVIPRIMTRLSNVRVRNVATVGGALAHGDPHMDLPPVAIALGGRVRIVGARGERELAVEDLLTGYYETALAPNELIASLTLPAQGKTRTAYMKVTAGAADDWPALGVAVALERRRRQDKVGARGGERGNAEGDAPALGRKAAGRRKPRRQDAQSGRRCRRRRSRDHRRPARLGRLQARAAARLCRPRAARGGGRRTMNAPATGKQIGRSLPRLEGRAKVSGRAEYTHTMRLPGMLVCQALAQHGAAWPHQVDRCVGGARVARRVRRLYRRGRQKGHSRSLLRAGLPRPADPGARQGALCRRAGGRRAGRGPAYRRAGRAADRRRIRGIAGGVRRARGGGEQGHRARGAEAGDDLCRPQASQRRQEHQLRARFQIAARRRGQGFRRRRPRVRAHLQDPESAASRLRAARLDRGL